VGAPRRQADCGGAPSKVAPSWRIATALGEQLFGKRKQMVEPVFGQTGITDVSHDFRGRTAVRT
jgi:hypothetical protein